MPGADSSIMGRSVEMVARFAGPFRHVGGGILSCCVCWLLVCPAPALAQGPSSNFWAFLSKGRKLTRCATDSPAHASATRALREFEAHVSRLKAPDPVGPVLAELYALLKTECFLLAAETDRVPAPDTSLSLKAWALAGGSGWLWSFLKVPLYGVADHVTPHIIIPPDARRTLALEGNEDHPLASILCRLGDASCGGETRGWRVRADAYLATRADLEPELGRQVENGSRDEALDRCQTEALKTGSYEQWQTCIEAVRTVQRALPLGQFRSPAHGWLLVAGRRGHYAFCDTVRAYDLQTGAAFVDDSCSELALAPGGSVDFEATDRGRARQTRAGHVSVDNLREAVWMLLLRGESERVQLHSEAHSLPTGLVPGLTVGDREGAGQGPGWSWHSGQTTLTWRWRPRVGPSFVGDLTWPNSYDAPEHYAAALLDVAERGFIETCPPVSIPSAGLLLSGTDTMLNEAAEDDAKKLGEHVRSAVERWSQLRPCASR